MTAATRNGMLAVVALATGLRVLYFAQLRDTPCIEQHRWEASDMAFFDAWARTIAAGDWLGREPFHPHATWLHLLAAQAQREMPALQTDVPSDESSADQWALVERWLGGATFHQEPLYPYLIALTYRILGADVRWVFAWQAAMGVGTILLALRCARRYFGPGAAIVAGILLCSCAALLHYDLVLLRTSAVAFAGMVLVELTDRARSGGRAGWLVVGFALGTAVLLTTTYVTYAIGLLAVFAAGVRQDLPRALRNAGGLVAGIACALAPAVARNVVVGVSPFALSSVGTLVFVMTNASDFVPGIGFMVSEHTARIMGGTDGRFIPAAVATLGTHAGPWSVLAMWTAKLAAAWHWYEIPNNTTVYFYALHAPVLTWLPVDFRVLTPLGIVGLVCALPYVRRTWPLYLLVATHLVPLVALYTLSRLRAPLIPALAPFVAFAVVELARAVHQGRIRRLAWMVPAALALGIWAGRPLPSGVDVVPLVDHATALRRFYLSRLETAQRRSDWPAVLDVAMRGLAHEPPLLLQNGTLGRSSNDQVEVVVLQGYARLHDGAARAYAEMNDPATASVHRDRAAALAAMAR